MLSFCLLAAFDGSYDADGQELFSQGCSRYLFPAYKLLWTVENTKYVIPEAYVDDLPRLGQPYDIGTLYQLSAEYPRLLGGGMNAFPDDARDDIYF